MPTAIYSEHELARVLIQSGLSIYKTRVITGASFTRCKQALEKIEAGLFNDLKEEVKHNEPKTLSQAVELAAMNIAMQIQRYKVGRMAPEAIQALSVSLVVVTRELKAIRGLESTPQKDTLPLNTAHILGNLSKDKLKQLANVVDSLLGNTIPEVSDLTQPVVYDDNSATGTTEQ